VNTRPIVVTALLLVGAAPAAAAYCEYNDWDCQNREAQKKAADDAWYEEQARKRQAEREQLRRALLKQPPLPAERNGLLGSWRLDDGQQGQTAAILGPMIGGGSGADTGLGGAMAGIANMVMSLEKGLCGLGVGSGVTFSPSTYSNSGNAGQAGNPIAYRAGVIGDKPAIAAIPDDSQQDMMVFAFASPNRIVGEDGCVLVRSGPPAAAVATSQNKPNAAAAQAPPATSAARPANANCKIAGVQLGVDTVASVERDIQARGGSLPSVRSGGRGFMMSAMSGDYQDAGTDVMAVNYDFDASGPDGRLVAVTIVNKASAVPDYETLLASRKAAAAAIAGPLQQKSATELVASGPGCQLRLLPNADTLFIYEVYQLPN
jgi:pyruvate/2-oxoglutarate dehydrogenase complex dihydrolipoamide acyltransferase (E2) component